MNIYCKKCGLRGDSKCPHCRSIFANSLPTTTDEQALLSSSQEYIEMFMMVGPIADEPPASNGERRYKVGFWTYANSSDEAAAQVLTRLQQVMNTKGLNLKVAACIHDWELMPGVKSSIDCGHEGPPNDNVPPDPYEPYKKNRK